MPSPPIPTSPPCLHVASSHCRPTCAHCTECWVVSVARQQLSPTIRTAVDDFDIFIVCAKNACLVRVWSVSVAGSQAGRLSGLPSGRGARERGSSMCYAKFRPGGLPGAHLWRRSAHSRCPAGEMFSAPPTHPTHHPWSPLTHPSSTPLHLLVSPCVSGACYWAITIVASEP
jgi:hypothetical protein